MIEINPNIHIPESEVHLDFMRASGPGGQNVNKVSSAVQLRFDIQNSPSINMEIKQRMIRLAGKRVNEDGVLVIEAKRYRTQEQNKLDALRRLITLVNKALEKPKVRKATRPSGRVRAARLRDKKKRGEIKRTRRYTPEDWE